MNMKFGNYVLFIIVVHKMWGVSDLKANISPGKVYNQELNIEQEVMFALRVNINFVFLQIGKWKVIIYYNAYRVQHLNQSDGYQDNTLSHLHI